MFNQIRAEFYKLFHTKALYLTFALILACLLYTSPSPRDTR